MAPSNETLDSVLSQITTPNSPLAWNHTLRNVLPKESRDVILASTLTGGQDPLAVLDVRENTLGVLYILAARFTVKAAAPTPWPVVREFCHSFNPEHARLAPDRVTVVAKGIAAFAEQMNDPKAAIEPLFDLVRRYPPDPSYLTTIHPVFVMTCVISQHYVEALPVLQQPITNIDTDLSDLTYNDNLLYHYLGGIVCAVLKRWPEAQELFEICVSSPGSVPAALQFEALKKLKLVQLISTGRTSSFPKYTHPHLPRMLKNTPYNALINAYPHDSDALTDIYEKEKSVFAGEQNLGLVQQAIDRAPRWALKKLTATYVTLSLADIARAVKIQSQEEVRELLLSMIESNDISAQISTDGAVTFSDVVLQVTREQVDRVLQEVQVQAAMLQELEREMGKSKEYLSKATKTKEESTWAGPVEEDLFTMSSSAAGAWADSDTLFS